MAELAWQGGVVGWCSAGSAGGLGLLGWDGGGWLVLGWAG